MIVSSQRTRRVLLLAGLVPVGAALAVTVWLATRPAGGAASAFRPPVLGAEPPGAVVQAAEDRDLAVALAVRARRHSVLLVATILGPDGAGATGLDVRFRLQTATGTTSLRGTAATPGYYEAEATASGRPVTVAVVVTGPGADSAPVRFVLPATWPPRSAGAVLRAADRAYARVRTLVTLEQLGSGPAHVVTSRYVAVAPDRLEITSDNGTKAVVIGSRRWDKVGKRPWQPSAQQPFPSIAPFWVGRVENAVVLGTSTIRGRKASVVSFAAPQMPAFFTAWIDKSTGRTLELRMTAAAHFMHHVYGPFDAPQQIRPPT